MMTDDDFWNDCYKTPAINTKAKSKAAKPEIIKIIPEMPLKNASLAAFFNALIL